MVRDDPRAKCGEKETDLQFSDQRYVAAVRVQFVREPAVWAAVDRVIARQCASRTAAAELVPVEGRALAAVDDVIRLLAERLAVRRFEMAARANTAAQDQLAHAAKIRAMAAEAQDERTAAGLESIAAESDQCGRELQRRPDRVREYVERNAQALAGVDLLHVGAQTVWGRGDAPLTGRKVQPHWQDLDEALELLQRVLAGDCASPGCADRARVETIAIVKRDGSTTSRKVRASSRPICCQRHGNARSGSLEKRARLRVRDLLAEYRQPSA